MRNLRLPALCAALSLFPACILHLGADGAQVDSWSDDGGIARARSDNRQRLQRVEVGMSKADLVDVMGEDAVWAGDETGWIDNPFRTESFPDETGRRVEVMFYYTHRVERDGVVSDDELTPVVLRDGKVEGWGHTHARRVMQ